jgi:hypothetical protein
VDGCALSRASQAGHNDNFERGAHVPFRQRQPRLTATGTVTVARPRRESIGTARHDRQR